MAEADADGNTVAITDQSQKTPTRMRRFTVNLLKNTVSQ